MKRMHIHVGVERLDEALKFYNALFGQPPVKTRDDYAKWMLDDPRVNFAISTRPQTGLDHLGIQVENDAELGELRDRLRQADLSLFDEGETVCCYARSDKSWVTDPGGIAWEAYKTMEDVQFFAGDENEALRPVEADKGASASTACCPPRVSPEAECCAPTETTTGTCG
ncbi:ArsI/CadI family heavy metal resistance metalloenzyme [Elongatibacter sediminis]|uniref:ArsI/CadI family heavy metal resistance metalloenzyme n=1 Tax=Elongatibacter sediminis TaxID=3119006 RepID=A0AAW9RCQ6_9GAMM